MEYFEKPTLGQRIADIVAAFVGSWTFILMQSAFLAGWIIINALGWVGFDPYPFILLNLFLSFQAAYTGPFVMMSQGRQADIDRVTMRRDLEADLRTGVIIEELRDKMELYEAKIDKLLTLHHITLPNEE